MAEITDQVTAKYAEVEMGPEVGLPFPRGPYTLDDRWRAGDEVRDPAPTGAGAPTNP